jgi:AcrR family transcriptional regulator
MPRVAAPPDVPGAILDATERLLESYGYKKMTMEDIAQEAGIGKATIYGYFNKKEDIALSVIDRHRQKILRRCREILTSVAPPDACLRQMIVESVLSGFDKAQRCRQSMDETMASLRPLALLRREHYNAELAPLLAEALQRGCEQGLFACPDVQIAARTIITCVSGFSPSNLSPRELGEREEIETRAHQVMDLLFQGLLVRPERAVKP